MVKAQATGLAARSKRKAASKPSTNSRTKRGIFITLEGGEGAGKSTQMQLMQDRLASNGYEVVTSREPGGSVGAEAVRHVLLSGAAEPFGAEMEAILFSASRADHVDTVIEPALKSGKIVISDRFFDSTRVYQGVSGKVSASFVRHLEIIACGKTWPDLTLIIDLDPKEGMARAKQRRDTSEVPDRFEKESLKLQKLRREAYLEIAADEPERCVVIDGSGSAEQVFERIWTVVSDRLGIEDSVKAKKVPTKKPTKKPAAKKTKVVSHRELTKAKSARTTKPRAKPKSGSDGSKA